MENTKNEIARLAHKDFFDRCKIALDNGYYLEAMFMEYSAIEGRFKKIFSLLNFDCAGDYDSKHSIGLGIKLSCLKRLMENDALFEKSYLSPSMISKVKKWVNRRDEITHALYTNTDRYDSMMSKNKKYAEKGFEYARLFYKEADRLKGIKKRHPERFDSPALVCNPTTERCIDFINELKSSQ